MRRKPFYHHIAQACNHVINFRQSHLRTWPSTLVQNHVSNRGKPEQVVCLATISLPESSLLSVLHFCLDGPVTFGCVGIHTSLYLHSDHQARWVVH